MTSAVRDWLPWFNEKTDWIRREAGHDAAKLEALIDDPALAREAAEEFPNTPLLYSMLREYLYVDRLLARHGIFLVDGPPTDEQFAEMQRQNRPIIAEWERSRQERDKDEEP